MDPDAEARSERPTRLHQAGQLAALWHATGMQQVEETALEMGMDFTSFDDYWQLIVTIWSANRGSTVKFALLQDSILLAKHPE